MDLSEKANKQKNIIVIPNATINPESFNYLNLEDSMVTQQTDCDTKDKSANISVKRKSKGINKIVHQISQYEAEDSDDNNSTDMTSYILAEEIFAPIVW